jgi:hypothetical protein
MALRMLPIARPCAESFAAMSGDTSKRFCSSCDKHVHDLSAGTEQEARALFEKNRGAALCVRFAKDGAGNVRFRGAAIAAAISLAACGSNAVDATTPNDVNAPIMTEAPQTKTDVTNANGDVDVDMGDSIPDELDRCPDQPTSESISDGCPDVPATTDPIDAGR